MGRNRGVKRGGPRPSISMEGERALARDAGEGKAKARCALSPPGGGRRSIVWRRRAVISLYYIVKRGTWDADTTRRKKEEGSLARSKEEKGLSKTTTGRKKEASFQRRLFSTILGGKGRLTRSHVYGAWGKVSLKTHHPLKKSTRASLTGKGKKRRRAGLR